MYRNSSDALLQLLSGSGVSQITATSGNMQNGITFCVVQVTLAGGEEYRIEDYGEEAEDLCRIAKERSAILCLH